MNHKKAKEELAKQGDFVCAIYGKPMLDLTEASIDHIIPISMGGSDNIENLQLTCRHCNTKKSSRLFSENQLLNYLKELLSINKEYDDIQTETAYRIGSSYKMVVDLIFRRKQDNSYIAAKVYGGSTFTLTRLDLIIDRFRIYKLLDNKINCFVLMFPGLLPTEYRNSLMEKGIEVWDKAFISNEFRKQIDKVNDPMFNYIFEYKEDEFIDYKVDYFVNKLYTCDSGREQWVVYQKLVGDMLDFLFCPPLEHPISELYDSNKANRRDYILPNYTQEGFWSFLRNRYHADYIVVDAKNSGNPIMKKDVLQIGNYLKYHGTGMFAIIFSRKGSSKNTEHTLTEFWGIQNKMIIVLNDTDVEQMLLAKKTGNNPEKLLQQKIEDFRLSL